MAAEGFAPSDGARAVRGRSDSAFTSALGDADRFLAGPALRPGTGRAPVPGQRTAGGARFASAAALAYARRQRMKRLLLTFVVTLALVSPAFAADLKWLTDLPQAKVQAKTEGKLVLLDFTGSDFCSSCIRLHKDVFSAKEFATFAQSRLVLMEVDFPLKKKQSTALKTANEALSKEFKVDGYPTLILLGSDGQKLGEVEFDLAEASAKDIIAAIEKLAKKAQP